jgi:hypothetical protein
MRRQTAIFGLLAIAAMVVAAIVSGAVLLNEPTPTAPSGETSYVPCASCDARHQRLGKDRSGKD